MPAACDTRVVRRETSARLPLAALLIAALLIAASLIAGLLPASASAQSAVWQPGVRAAIAYAHTRAGVVSFDVRTEQRDRPLTVADHRLIDPMIERSDNAAATAVLAFVGARGVYGVAERAHMRRFSLDPVIWGLSRIDAADQTRFFLHIDSHVVARHRATAMHLLASIIPAQRWGIGELKLPGWQLYFKGGWGAGTGEVEHQVALLRHGAIRVSVAVLITSSPSHEYAKETLRGVFARLLRHVGELLPADADGAGRFLRATAEH
jgi:hypothetical protein